MNINPKTARANKLLQRTKAAEPLKKEIQMRNFIVVLIIGIVVFFIYGIVGTSSRVDEIKLRVPESMVERGWEILRYEGYQLGSFGKHGGKVWYHVRNVDNHEIQYRVMVSLWGGELHFTYGSPEKLSGVDLLIKDKSGIAPLIK